MLRPIAFPACTYQWRLLPLCICKWPIGPWAFVFPMLIALSCIFTKQHYVIDLPAGAMLGWVSFICFQWLL